MFSRLIDLRYYNSRRYSSSGIHQVVFIKPKYYYYKEWSITMKYIFKTFSTSSLRQTLPYHVTGKLGWNAKAGHGSSVVKSTIWWSEGRLSAKKSLCFLLSAPLWTCKIVRYVNLTKLKLYNSCSSVSSNTSMCNCGVKMKWR